MGPISRAFKECESSLESFSTYATVNLTDDRNGTPPLHVEEADEEKYCRKITAEIGYALLLVVSLIELVVRALLSLVAFPVLLIMNSLDCSVSAKGYVLLPTIAGTLVTAENTAKLAVLLFTNFCEEEIDYDQTAPDFSECNDCFGNYVNDFFGDKLHRPEKLEEQQEEVIEEKF